MYVAKQVVAAALMGLSHLALVALTLVGGFLLWCLWPGSGFQAAIPWGRLLGPVAIAYLASWLILGIHTWVGLRWRSFALASAVGIVFTVAGVAIISSRWGSYYPWALPRSLINDLHKGEPLRWAGLALGACEVTRRDVL